MRVCSHSSTASKCRAALLDWINAEVERAKTLHSGDEAEAITELLTRSRDLPDQRTRMITMTALNIVAVSRLPPKEDWPHGVQARFS